MADRFERATGDVSDAAARNDGATEEVQRDASYRKALAISFFVVALGLSVGGLSFLFCSLPKFSELIAIDSTYKVWAAAIYVLGRASFALLVVFIAAQFARAAERFAVPLRFIREPSEGAAHMVRALVGAEDRLTSIALSPSGVTASSDSKSK